MKSLSPACASRPDFNPLANVRPFSSPIALGRFGLSDRPTDGYVGAKILRRLTQCRKIHSQGLNQTTDHLSHVNYIAALTAL